MSSKDQAQKNYSVYPRKDSPFLWVKLSLNGHDFSESTKHTGRKKAERYAQQRVAELLTDTFITPKSLRMGVEELMEALFDDYSINEAKSIDDARTRWNLHLKKSFAHLRAVNVTTDSLKKYVLKRHNEKASNGTINRELALLKRAFYLGYKSSPRKVREVPVFPHLEESDP